MFIEFGSGGFPGTGMIGAGGFPFVSGGGGDLPDPPAVPDGCVLFLDLANWDADYTATLQIVTPLTVGGRAVTDDAQEKTVNSDTGRIAFDEVPQGCKVEVICDHAGINGTYQVPTADYLALATATPL
jgi:hypothetical protein